MGSIGYILWRCPATGHKIEYWIDLTTDKHAIRFTITKHGKLIEDTGRAHEALMVDISRSCPKYGDEHVLAKMKNYAITIQPVVLKSSFSRVKTTVIEDRKQETLYGGRVIQKKKIMRKTHTEVFQNEIQFKIRGIPGYGELACLWSDVPFHDVDLQEFTNQLESFCKKHHI